MTLIQVRDHINLAMEKNKDDPRMQSLMDKDIESITVIDGERLSIATVEML